MDQINSEYGHFSSSGYRFSSLCYESNLFITFWAFTLRVSLNKALISWYKLFSLKINNLCYELNKTKLMFSISQKNNWTISSRSCLLNLRDVWRSFIFILVLVLAISFQNINTICVKRRSLQLLINSLENAPTWKTCPA